MAVGAVVLLLAAHAQAQETFTYQGPVLSAQTGITFASQSVGAPSVAYDSINDRFLMAFEAKTPASVAACPHGVWALGFATSPDGITWTVNANPMVLPGGPGSGTYYSCVAAQPAAVFDASGNGKLQVLFKAEQDSDACATSPYAGCPYTGIGRVRLVFDSKGDVSTVTIQANPVVELDGPGGHPSFVYDAAFALAYQRYPDIYTTSSSVVSSFPTGSANMAVSSDWGSANAYVYDEFKSPSLICDDDSIILPWAMFVTSVDTNFGAVIDGAWSKAVSSNGASWTLQASAWETWTNDSDWRHADFLRVTGGDYLVWYSVKDKSGNSSIYFGATDASFNNTDVQSRICP